MRKWLWGGGIVAVVIIAGWGALRLLQADIGMTLFERQAKEIVGTDASAALENGLHVYLCGTGSPLPDPSRAGPCLGILAGQSAFIFDTGSGSMRKLARMGFPMGQTKAAFLTHLHSDHIDGLGEMMLQAWIVGSRSTPLPIYGPVGTQQVSGSFVSAYQIDSQYRVAHHGEKVANPQGFGLAAEEIEFEEGRRQKVRLQIQLVRGVHALPEAVEAVPQVQGGGVRRAPDRTHHHPRRVRSLQRECGRRW